MSKIKNVVVTGAGRGIGLELTKQLLRLGHRVFATRRNPFDAKELMDLMLSNSEKLSLHSLDVASDNSCSLFSEELGDVAIDVLINNAGVLDTYDSSIDTMDFGSFAKVLNVNTLGPLRVMQAVMPQLRKSDNALVLNISSQMGSLAGTGAGAHAYRTSKAALNKAMTVVASEVKAELITVINAHPGWVQTEMGGSGADINVATSARGLIELLNKGLNESGSFFDYQGNTIDW